MNNPQIIVKNAPFKRFCMSIGAIPTSYLDSLDYYETLLWLIKYLEETIIPTVNNNGEAVSELQTLYSELKNYVDNYFTNLDVQEEINNKLDEMVESGELETIIENFAFKNYDISNNYGINYQKLTNTQYNIIYHLTRLTPRNIPKIHLKGGLAFDNITEAIDGYEPLLDIARRNNAMVITNASTRNDLLNKLIIRNKQVLNPTYTSPIMILAIDEDGQLDCFDNTYSADTLINQYKVVNTWGNSGPLILNGEVMYDEWSKVESDIVNNKHPRTCIIQEYNSNDIIFLNIEGRKNESAGVTFDEWASFIQSILPNTRIAYAMGGGGDTQLIIKGEVMNDCNDLTIRKLKDSIYLDFNVDSENSTLEQDLINSRSTNAFLSDLLNKRLPYNNSYLNNTKVVKLRYVGENCFVGDMDYNTDVRDNQSIFVQFPKESEVDSITLTSACKINLHYSAFSNQNIIDTNGKFIYPKQLFNKIVLLNNINGNFVVDNNNIFEFLGRSTDINTLKQNGKYFSNNFTNNPISPRNNAERQGWLLVYEHPQINDYVFQIMLTRPVGEVFYRICENGTWTTWKCVANYNEIMLRKPSINTNNDLNNFKFNNAITVAYGNSMSNIPTSAGNGWVIYIPYPDDDSYGMQLYIDRKTTGSSGRIYLRTLNNGTWSTWNKFVTDAEVQTMIDNAIANLNN